MAVAAQQTASEQSVWKLEHSYWEYVKANNIESYRALWHPNFVGWPSVSAEPQRKNHITDWITQRTDQGLRLKAFELKPASSQSTGDLVITHYWLTAVWTGKSGDQPSSTSRITHTWVRVGKSWQIIGGMSSPEPHTRK